MRYKQSVVRGFVHRIERDCSTWKYFHSSITKVKQAMECNQHPPSSYEPIIEKAISKAKTKFTTNNVVQSQSSQQSKESTSVQKNMIFNQYQRKVTETIPSTAQM